MPERISELFGLFLGYLLGLIFAAGSILRNSRIFHPRGILFYSEIETLPDSPISLPEHAIVRFSSAWWKTREWPDVLGIALRISHNRIITSIPAKTDQDLLFASFRRPWEIFFAPFLTEHRNFQDNTYYAISPFSLSNGTVVDIMIDPVSGHRSVGTREEKLLGNVMSGNLVLRLMIKERKKQSWKMIARIRVKEESFLDQEDLRFHPFQKGCGIRPYGFLHYLRHGPYKMSQWVRPGSRHDS